MSSIKKRKMSSIMIRESKISVFSQAKLLRPSTYHSHSLSSTKEFNHKRSTRSIFISKPDSGRKCLLIPNGMWTHIPSTWLHVISKILVVIDRAIRQNRIDILNELQESAKVFYAEPIYNFLQGDQKVTDTRKLEGENDLEKGIKHIISSKTFLPVSTVATYNHLKNYEFSYDLRKKLHNKKTTATNSPVPTDLTLQSLIEFMDTLATHSPEPENVDNQSKISNKNVKLQKINKLNYVPNSMISLMSHQSVKEQEEEFISLIKGDLLYGVSTRDEDNHRKLKADDDYDESEYSEFSKRFCEKTKSKLNQKDTEDLQRVDDQSEEINEETLDSFNSEITAKPTVYKSAMIYAKTKIFEKKKNKSHVVANYYPLQTNYKKVSTLKKFKYPNHTIKQKRKDVAHSDTTTSSEYSFKTESQINDNILGSKSFKKSPKYNKPERKINELLLYSRNTNLRSKSRNRYDLNLRSKSSSTGEVMNRYSSKDLNRNRYDLNLRSKSRSKGEVKNRYSSKDLNRNRYDLNLRSKSSSTGEVKNRYSSKDLNRNRYDLNLKSKSRSTGEVMNRYSSKDLSYEKATSKDMLQMDRIRTKSLSHYDQLKECRVIMRSEISRDQYKEFYKNTLSRHKRNVEGLYFGRIKKNAKIQLIDPEKNEITKTNYYLPKNWNFFKFIRFSNLDYIGNYQAYKSKVREVVNNYSNKTYRLSLSEINKQNQSNKCIISSPIFPCFYKPSFNKLTFLPENKNIHKTPLVNLAIKTNMKYHFEKVKIKKPRILYNNDVLTTRDYETSQKTSDSLTNSETKVVRMNDYYVVNMILVRKNNIANILKGTTYLVSESIFKPFSTFSLEGKMNFLHEQENLSDTSKDDEVLDKTFESGSFLIHKNIFHYPERNRLPPSCVIIEIRTMVDWPRLLFYGTLNITDRAINVFSDLDKNLRILTNKEFKFCDKLLCNRFEKSRTNMNMNQQHLNYSFQRSIKSQSSLLESELCKSRALFLVENDVFHYSDFQQVSFDLIFNEIIIFQRLFSNFLQTNFSYNFRFIEGQKLEGDSNVIRKSSQHSLSNENLNFLMKIIFISALQAVTNSSFLTLLHGDHDHISMEYGTIILPDISQLKVLFYVRSILGDFNLEVLSNSLPLSSQYHFESNMKTIRPKEALEKYFITYFFLVLTKRNPYPQRHGVRTIQIPFEELFPLQRQYIEVRKTYRKDVSKKMISFSIEFNIRLNKIINQILFSKIFPQLLSASLNALKKDRRVLKMEFYDTNIIESGSVPIQSLFYDDVNDVDEALYFDRLMCLSSRLSQNSHYKCVHNIQYDANNHLSITEISSLNLNETQKTTKRDLHGNNNKLKHCGILQNFRKNEDEFRFDKLKEERNIYDSRGNLEKDNYKNHKNFQKD